MKKYIDRDLVARLHERALALPRRRTHHNLHSDHADAIQRLCLAIEPGSYVRPHRHPHKWELLLIVCGKLAVLTFSDEGTVLERTLLSSGGHCYGIENPAGTWHSVVSLAPSTMIFECKPGPYTPTPEQDFAAWAPPEGDRRAAEFERWYRTAEPGEVPPARGA